MKLKNLKQRLVRLVGSRINSALRSRGYAIKVMSADERFDYTALYPSLYATESLNQRRFYNIGVGPNWRHPYWTNVDMPSDHYMSSKVDISFDLMSGDPLPIDDNSAEIIYSSHCIEHIRNENLLHFAQEARRSLKDGGILRLVTPDSELVLDAYLRGDRAFFQRHHGPATTLEQGLLIDIATQRCVSQPPADSPKFDDQEVRDLMVDAALPDAFDKLMNLCSVDIQRRQPNQHVNWYNSDKLCGLLKQAGFSDVYRSSYGASQSPVLRDRRYFDSSRPYYSLYVEARKTA
jgi:SAM-dependent methyltransferase